MHEVEKSGTIIMAKPKIKKSRKKKSPKKKAMRKKESAGKTARSGIISDMEYIMGIMEANDIAEVNIEDGSRRISIRKNNAFAGPAGVPAAPPRSPAAAAVASVGDVQASGHEDEGLIEITSPIVGTFYAAPSPDSDPFVSEGDRIKNDTVVCIVEAMKVMNEIKAECKGLIAEICVKNAEPVEFGQVLFRVRPE